MTPGVLPSELYGTVKLLRAVLRDRSAHQKVLIVVHGTRLFRVGLAPVDHDPERAAGNVHGQGVTVHEPKDCVS